MTNPLRLFAVLGLTIAAGIALLIAFPVGSPSPEEAGRAVDQTPAVQPGLPPAEVETPNTAKSLDLQPPPDSSTSAAKPPLSPIAELESHVASAPDQEMIRPELPEQAQTLPEDPPATMPSAVAPSSLSVAEPGIPGSSITASTPPEAGRSAEPLLSVPTSSTETHASDTAALSKVETPAEPAAVSRRVEQRAAPLQKAPIPISPPQLAPRSLARPHKGSTVAEE